MVHFPTRMTEHSKTANNDITNIEPNNLNVTGVITHVSDNNGQILEILNLNLKYYLKIMYAQNIGL